MQDVFRVPLGKTEGPQSSPDTSHGSVVVGTLDVDRPAEAPLPLRHVVRDVRKEVGRGTIAAHHDAVLLVAELRGAQPGRTIAFENQTRAAEGPDRVLDLAVLVEGGLAIEAVEPDPKVVEITPDLGHESTCGEAPQLFLGFLRFVAQKLLTSLSDQPVRQLHDVLAMVPPGRNFVGFPESLSVTGQERAGQQPHLSSGIVVVELPVHGPTRPFQQRAQRVPERGLPPVPQVQRARGVRRDPFDDDPLALTRIAPTPSFVGFDDSAEAAGREHPNPAGS